MMGIDLYLYCLEDKKRRYKKYGGEYYRRPERAYIRESYGHFFYATKAFIPWTWDDWKQSFPNGPPGVRSVYNTGKLSPERVEFLMALGQEFEFEGVVIPAKYMRANLVQAHKVAALRYRGDLVAVREHKNALTTFVEVAEALERKGKTPLVYNSY